MTQVMMSLPIALHYVVYIRACFCFALIGRTLTAQLMGIHWGIGGGIQIPET